MQIVVVAGLPLSGKTTVAKELEQIYTNKGIQCIYRKGQLTDSALAAAFRKKAFEVLGKWNFVDDNLIQEYIDLGFKSFSADYQEFERSRAIFANIDLCILDRHWIDQYVVAEYFGVNPPGPLESYNNYTEFSLQCNYPEAIRRSLIRKDNHGRLTDYILGAESVFVRFQGIYEEYILNRRCYSAKHIVDNNSLCAVSALESAINELL